MDIEKEVRELLNNLSNDNYEEVMTNLGNSELNESIMRWMSDVFCGEEIDGGKKLVPTNKQSWALIAEFMVNQRVETITKALTEGGTAPGELERLGEVVALDPVEIMKLSFQDGLVLGAIAARDNVIEFG